MVIDSHDRASGFEKNEFGFEADQELHPSSSPCFSAVSNVIYTCIARVLNKHLLDNALESHTRTQWYRHAESTARTFVRHFLFKPTHDTGMPIGIGTEPECVHIWNI